LVAIVSTVATGAAWPVDRLHFETCFYQGMDYAIAHGVQRFDAGAQGGTRTDSWFRTGDHAVVALPAPSRAEEGCGGFPAT
jgi:hypothetical protein